MDNLKPCPFCGGNVAYTQNDITGEHHIECLECAVLVLFDVDLLKEDVVAHWNTRTPIPKPTQSKDSSGMYHRDLTASEMNADTVSITISPPHYQNTNIVEEEQ